MEEEDAIVVRSEFKFHRISLLLLATSHLCSAVCQTCCVSWIWRISRSRIGTLYKSKQVVLPEEIPECIGVQVFEISNEGFWKHALGQFLMSLQEIDKMLGIVFVVEEGNVVVDELCCFRRGKTTKLVVEVLSRGELGDDMRLEPVSGSYDEVDGQLMEEFEEFAVLGVLDKMKIVNN